MPTQVSNFPHDALVQRRHLKSGESTTIAKGKLVYVDPVSATLKLCGADDPVGAIGIAEEAIPVGKEGPVLFGPGYTTAADLNGFSDGDILTAAAGGGLAAVDGHQERRIAQVVDASDDLLYFNGYSI